MAVFRGDWVPGQRGWEYGVLDWPTGLEVITPDVVVLSVASGDEYRATRDDSSTGGRYTLLGFILPRAHAVRLTSAPSCDPEVVGTRTVYTRSSVCGSAVRDRY